MTTNWLEERIPGATQEYIAGGISFGDCIRKHFGDLDPTAKDAEIAGLMEACKSFAADRDKAMAEVERLEKVVGQLGKMCEDSATAIAAKDAEIAELKRKLSTCTENYHASVETAGTLRKHLQDLEAACHDHYWRWQGDGTDNPESLVCPVVMGAEQLREMLSEITELRASLEGMAETAKAWGETQGKIIAELRAEVERLKTELAAKPKCQVLREAGIVLDEGNVIVFADGETRRATGKYTEPCWDYGPVPPFPPQEPSEPKPEWKRVRHKTSGATHWAFETEIESAKSGLRYWRTSKEVTIPGEYVEVLP